MTFAKVQTGDTNGTVNSGSAGTILPANPTIGNIILVAIIPLSSANRDVASMSSTMGTPQYVSSERVSGQGDIEIWAIPVTATGKTITPTMTDGAQYQAMGIEVSGSVNSIVAVSGATADSAAPSLTVNPPNTNCFLFVFTSSVGNGAFTGGPGSPWSYYDAGVFTWANGADTAWTLASTSQTATWTTGSNLVWLTVGAILTPPGANQGLNMSML